MWHVMNVCAGLAVRGEDNAHFCYHHQHVLIRRTDGMISNSPGMNPRFEYLIYRYYRHSQARHSSGKYNQRLEGWWQFLVLFPELYFQNIHSGESSLPATKVP